MINKKRLEYLFKKFVEKGTDFSLTEIEERDDKSCYVELQNCTCNYVDMYHDFFLEKEDLINIPTCLKAIASKMYATWEDWDKNEEFKMAYESGYMEDHPDWLMEILNDYDDKLETEVNLVYDKIYTYLNKLEEHQEQENKDDQR